MTDLAVAPGIRAPKLRMKGPFGIGDPAAGERKADAALGVGLRFRLELGKIERQSECTGDVARG